jgi:hypothetical protein
VCSGELANPCSATAPATILYDHTEAVGKISPLVFDIFLIPFPAEIPGRKKDPTPKRFIKKATGYAWREKKRTF